MTQPQTRRRVLAALGTAATAGLAGCASVFATSEYDVGMRTQAFAPKTLQVDPGTTVVWRNTSTRGHTVTAYEDTLPDGVDFFASGGYESEAAAREAWQETSGGRLETDDTFEHTFESPGQYSYVCLPHEEGGMVGTIIVEK
jgi:plastocyanin